MIKTIINITKIACIAGIVFCIYKMLDLIFIF